MATKRNMVKPIDIAAGNAVAPDGVPCYAYTYGGHKFLKTTELANEEEEARLYLGGAEFVDGQPESYYHGEGRVALTGDKPAFQYKLTDHLGNTMVLFEDKDGDKIITTESMSTDPALVEVLQRNFYYAFGLPMQGPWNHAPADPDMPYLYNGKELEGELGLGWYAYGFRYYDASVGRFVGVDPLAGMYVPISPYGYAINNPIFFVDPNGMHIEPVVTKGGGKDGRDLMTIKVTGKLINFSDNNVNMERALTDIKTMVESSFQGEDVNGMDIKVDFDFSIANSMEDVAESDHLIVLANGLNDKIPGVSNAFGGKVTAVDADYFTGFYDVYIGEEGERTAAHELGHLFGLEHVSGVTNLMSQGRAELRGNNITNQQLNEMRLNAEGKTSTKLNQGSSYNYQGLPNLGIGYKVMSLTNTNGRNKSLTIEQIRKMIDP